MSSGVSVLGMVLVTLWERTAESSFLSSPSLSPFPFPFIFSRDGLVVGLAGNLDLGVVSHFQSCPRQTVTHTSSACFAALAPAKESGLAVVCIGNFPQRLLCWPMVPGKLIESFGMGLEPKRRKLGCQGHVPEDIGTWSVCLSLCLSFSVASS